MPTININDAYILDETGAEVDKVTGLFTKDENATSGEKQMARLNIAAGGTNPNLLDNPFFTINQRSFTTSSATNGVRCVDRWFINNGGGTGGSTTLNSNGTMTITSGTAAQTFQQTIEIVPTALVGKSMTVSLMQADGTIEYKSFVVPAQNSAEQEMGRLTSTKYRVFAYLRPTGNNTLVVQLQVFAGQTIQVRAAKLELGTVSTLANDSPPDYATELLKCMRYFIRLTGYNNENFGFGYAIAGTIGVIHLPIPVPMRTTPTVSTNGSFNLIGAGAAKTVTAIGTPANGINGIQVQATSSSLTTNQPYMLVSAANGTYIDISADL